MSLQQRLCRTWKVCVCTCHSTFATLLHVLEIWNKKFIVPPCSQWLSVSDQQMFNRFMSLAQNVYLTTLFSKIPKKLKYSNVQRSKITARLCFFLQRGCKLFAIYLCCLAVVPWKWNFFLGLFQVTIKGADAVKLHFFGVLLDKRVIWLFANTLSRFSVTGRQMWLLIMPAITLMIELSNTIPLSNQQPWRNCLPICFSCFVLVGFFFSFARIWQCWCLHFVHYHNTWTRPSARALSLKRHRVLFNFKSQ